MPLRLTSLIGMAKNTQKTAAFSFTHITDGSDDVSAARTTETFTGVSLGADVTKHGDRRYTVITYVCSDRNDSISCQVAGVDATVVVKANAISPNDVQAVIFIADTTGKGSTGDITFTCGASFGKSGYGVYRMINPSGRDPYDTNSDNTHVSGVLDLDLNVPTGGVALGAFGGQNVSPSAGNTCNWTGLTEDFDYAQAGNEAVSSAHGFTTGTPLTVTATSVDSTPTAVLACSASWGP